MSPLLVSCCHSNILPLTSVAYHVTNLFSYNSEGKKSRMSVMRVKARCQQGQFLLEAPRVSPFLGSSISTGVGFFQLLAISSCSLFLWSHGFFLHFSQISLFLSLSLCLPLLKTCDCIGPTQIIQDNLFISKSLV